MSIRFGLSIYIDIDIDITTNISRQVSELWKKIKQYFQNLNYFPSPTVTDEHELRTQQISTRLFIFLFILSLVILLLYISLIKITKTVNVQTPTRAQYLQLDSTYSQTLTCACTKISINYEKFLHINYTLHQVCSSIFVSQNWIDYLAKGGGGTLFTSDFRWTSPSAFQALRTFCDLINRTISDSLIQFYSNQHVSTSVIPLQLFLSKTDSLTDQFRSSIKNRFLLSLSTIRDTTKANNLFSALITNYNLDVSDNDHGIIARPCRYDGCSCDTSSICASESVILSYPNKTILFKVPAFYTGCYVIESLLQSTLQCIYNQKCIDDLLAHVRSSSSMTIRKLDSSLPSRFFVNSTIKELVDNLMIEQWNSPPGYDRYYNECQPALCTYTVETRNDAIYIFATLFALVGGLPAVLKLIIPWLVKFVRKKKEHPRPITGVEQRQHIRHVLRKSKHYVVTYNIFPSAPPSTEERELRTQRISTRLFTFLFILSLVILLLYISLIKITKTVNVQTPTLAQYSQLDSTYSQTLTCTCTKISINYKTFLYINYTLHQVCSSMFVTQNWIDYLTTAPEKMLYSDDFRWTSPSAFQALRTFCDLINRTISNSLIQFYSSQYVSTSVIPVHLFELETQSLIEQFRSSMRNSFLLPLSMIRDITQANALLSALLTNYNVYISRNGYDIGTRAVTYNDCNCGFSSTCAAQTLIAKYPNATILLKVPDFYKGCFVIESLLQSTLQCFYNQKCINDLRPYLSPSWPITVIALNSSVSSHYFENSTIEELVDNLMIEQWNSLLMYDRYYNECQPAQCTYTVRTRNDAIYIVNTLFGIVGGLITVLKLIIPRLVKFIRKKKEHPRPITMINNEKRATVLLWQKCKHFVQNLNFFPSVPPSTDEHKLRTQRISTRLFTFLFILSLVILLLYTSLIKVTKTINVQTPTLAQYSQLDSTYSQTLTCTCTKISISYEKFLHINYTLHQVCSSMFVSQNWISYLSALTGKTFYTDDFRWTGSSAFKALSTFCDLINRTISESLIQFYSSQRVIASVIPIQLFELETESLIQQFRSSMRNSFLSSLSMVRHTTQANALLSGLKTNYILKVVNGKNLISSVETYNSCYCSSSLTCIGISIIAEYPNATLLSKVPGFYTGCYVIESLLQSTLQCFYSQKCINDLRPHLSPSWPINVIALNSSVSSHYFKTSTIKELVDNLMIEEWNSLLMYDRYYNECRPAQCTYTVETRNDAIYIFTTVFGIARGLIMILELVVPRLVRFIVYCIQKRRIRVVPEVSPIDT